jgi:SET domain-containing protein
MSTYANNGEKKAGADLRVGRSKAGLGLFAVSPIRKGQTAIEYVGNVVSDDSYVQNRYIFEVGPGRSIDGSPRWNKARYINHSCRPNCEAVNRRGRIFIIAKRPIAPGEELTYDYGREYFDQYIRPHGCRCEKCSVG